MADVTKISDLNATLEPGHRYLLVFNLPGGIPVDILRKISDGANMTRTFLGQYGKTSHIDLLGTTVRSQTDIDPPQLLALINVTGTPLLAAVTPIVAVVLIVATVYLVIQFKHAIDVTAQAVAVTVTKAGEDAGAAVQKIADGIGAGVADVGTGLKYGLPVFAVALVGAGAIWFVGLRKAVA